MEKLWLSKIFRDEKRNNFLDALEENNTHPKETHVGLNDVSLLERGLENHISVGTFETVSDYKECLLQVIQNEQDTIEEALQEKEQGERFVINSVLPDDIYSDPEDPYDFTTRSRCFHLDEKTNAVREVTTNAYRMVLRKDDLSAYGFTIITFYPNANTKYLKNPDIHVEETNRDLSPVLEHTMTYRHAPLLEKISLKARINPQITTSVHYVPKEQTYQTVIRLQDPNDPDRKRAEVGLEETTYADKHGKEIAKDDLTLCKQQSPYLVHDVRILEDLRDEQLQQQTKSRDQKNKRLSCEDIQDEKEQHKAYADMQL